MFSAAVITDRNGSLDWVVLGCARFATAEEVWREPATDGAVLRWAWDHGSDGHGSDGHGSDGHGADPRPTELIVEAFCSRCDATTDGYLIGTGFDDDLAALRLCAGCALAVPPAEMLRWVSIEQAAAELGVPVRLTDGEAGERIRRERRELALMQDVEAGAVGGQLRERVADPEWREHVARSAADNPQVVIGIAAAVAALGDGDVLDLYPCLAALGRALPRAATRWLETSGPVAAARLGLPCLGAGA
jgi:hypothetical protein